jgi:hypothetical protein
VYLWVTQSRKIRPSVPIIPRTVNVAYAVEMSNHTSVDPVALVENAVLRLVSCSHSGLWDAWTSSDGEVMERCTMLTTGPNSLEEDLYNRMPVIATADKYDLWLDPDGTFSDGSFGS